MFMGIKSRSVGDGRPTYLAWYPSVQTRFLGAVEKILSSGRAFLLARKPH